MIPPIAESLATIAKMIGATRPLVAFDLETTGTSVANDRIVEISASKWHPVAGVTTHTRRLHPGIAIPKGATAVHGIGDADVAGSPNFGNIAVALADYLCGCDFLGFNLRSYDLPLLLAEFARCGKPFDFGNAKVLDAKELFFRKEPRDLGAAVRFYTGDELVGAHGAAADNEATVAVLAKQLERYGDVPRDVTGLAAYCLNRAPESLTDCGRIVWRDGAPRFTFSKNAGVALSDVDIGFFKWVISNDFPKDVKAICADAMSGKMPSKPEGIE